MHEPSWENSKIILSPYDGQWIIEISKNGFKFNREDYPDALPDDFAQAFVDILEKKFDVTMQKRDEARCKAALQEGSYVHRSRL